MKNKDLIYNTLLELQSSDGIDTITISNITKISRANVSHELNCLCKEGKIYKTSSRPVKFFINNPKLKTNIKSDLDKLAENNISMTSAIEQAKASILYPPKGMNCLILGETGVGKSMFANLMYKYAIDMEMKDKNSPFITFNCADYCNNPQLLTSQLFGVKKGAYTGSENDRVGLIEKANGGILFLDEVHRLPPEGQEALFIFLDTHKFRRIGDSETRTSDVLIICATTENPSSVLLDTFTRRIPMVISIPPLRERTFEERLYLIKNFFKEESIRLNKEICVSINSMRALISYNCSNNIGQLKSDIQLICAKAYSLFLTNKKDSVIVVSRNLPNYIQDGLYKEKEHRVLWNKLMREEIDFFKFSAKYSDSLIQSNNDTGIYSFIKNKLGNLKSQGISNIDIEEILEKDIANYYTISSNSVANEINRTNLFNIMDDNILDCFDLIINYINKELKHPLNNTIYTAFALHINTLIRRINNNKPILNSNLSKIQQLYKKEFQVALGIKEILENTLNISVPMEECGYLALFLVPEMKFTDSIDDIVKVIVIAHGESTASSMKNVADKLLEEECVLAIDAPIEVSAAEILDKLRVVIKNNPSNKGYILLVDMGSFTTFSEIIEEEFNIPVKVIPLVSTLHVLEAARKALMKSSLNSLYNDVLMVNSYINIRKNNKNPKKKKSLILSACLTGKGGSIAIKNFIKENFNIDENLFEIKVLDCIDKNTFINTINLLKEKYNILFIVTPFSLDSNISIPNFTMSDILNPSEKGKIQELIDIQIALYNIPNVLKENINSLPANELYEKIITFVSTIEKSLTIIIPDKKKVSLILHLAFAINRLINNEPMVEYDNKEYMKNNYFDLYSIIKSSSISIENHFSIKINDDEICYIMDFIIN